MLHTKIVAWWGCTHQRPEDQCLKPIMPQDFPFLAALDIHTLLPHSRLGLLYHFSLIFLPQEYKEGLLGLSLGESRSCALLMSLRVAFLPKGWWVGSKSGEGLQRELHGGSWTGKSSSLQRTECTTLEQTDCGGVVQGGFALLQLWVFKNLGLGRRVSIPPLTFISWPKGGGNPQDTTLPLLFLSQSLFSVSFFWVCF